MKNQNKVSIIILTYNNWHLLKDSISSVAKQKFEGIEFELIISDDASADFDKLFVNNLLVEHNLEHKTKIHINQSNLGTVRSFNNAIRKANGQIIIPLAADDCFYDDRVIKDIVVFFYSNKDALIVTGLQIPFDKDKNYPPTLLEKRYPLFDSCKLLLKYITLKHNIISGASTYYRKSIFEKYGYFDEEYRLLEDYPYYLKLLSHNCKINLIKRKVIKYRLGGISTSKEINPLLESDFRKARKYAISIADINIFQKRRTLFKRGFNDQERKKNILKYPEQAAIFYSSYFFKNIKCHLIEK